MSYLSSLIIAAAVVDHIGDNTYIAGIVIILGIGRLLIASDRTLDRLLG